MQKAYGCLSFIYSWLSKLIIKCLYLSCFARWSRNGYLQYMSRSKSETFTAPSSKNNLRNVGKKTCWIMSGEETYLASSGGSLVSLGLVLRSRRVRLSSPDMRAGTSWDEKNTNGIKKRRILTIFSTSMQIIARQQTASLDISFFRNGGKPQLLFNVDRNVVLRLKMRSYQRLHPLTDFSSRETFQFLKKHKK